MHGRDHERELHSNMNHVKKLELSLTWTRDCAASPFGFLRLARFRVVVNTAASCTSFLLDALFLLVAMDYADGSVFMLVGILLLVDSFLLIGFVYAASAADPRVKVETVFESASSPPRSRRKHLGVRSYDFLWDKPVEDFFSSESESDDDMENYI
ncbi:hypothetical protein Tco_0862170, partial [Tanacetum coccineum]